MYFTKKTIEEKKINEIEILKEVVNDYDEINVSAQTIFDFIDFWNFFNDLFNLVKKQSLEAFLKSIEDQITFLILKHFKTSKNHFQSIQELYLELTQKEEVKRQQILSILNHSIIRVKPENKNFDLEVDIVGNKQNLQVADILELKHRANLIIYTERNKKNNKYHHDEEKFKVFDALAGSLISICDLLNKLKSFGITHCIDLNTHFECKKNIFDEILDFQKKLLILWMNGQTF